MIQVSTPVVREYIIFDTVTKEGTWRWRGEAIYSRGNAHTIMLYEPLELFLVEDPGLVADLYPPVLSTLIRGVDFIVIRPRYALYGRGIARGE